MSDTKISLESYQFIISLFLWYFELLEPKLSIWKCNGKIIYSLPVRKIISNDRVLAKKGIPPRNAINHHCKSVQRVSSSKMAREIYVFITCRCLACFRYTSVTKYILEKWNVGVGVTIFQEGGRWISCEAFMTQFQPTTFIMTCKSGVGSRFPCNHLEPRSSLSLPF